MSNVTFQILCKSNVTYYTSLLFDYFYISDESFQCLTIFKCINQAAAEVNRLNSNKRTAQKHQSLLNTVHIKNMQSNKMNII